MGSSANSNQNMNMIIPGRSLQPKLSRNAIKASLQTFTGLALGLGALNNIDYPQSNKTLSARSILCSALGNGHSGNPKDWNMLKYSKLFIRDYFEIK